MLGDAGEHVGQPSLGVDIVELGGDDEAVQEGGALAAAIGAGEQPRSARSAVLLVRQMRPSSRKRAKEAQRLSM